MYRRVVCTALVIACCALGACSSDGAADRADREGTPASSTGEDAAAVESCDLLTVSDIERITDTVLPDREAATEERTDGWSVCNWEDPEAGAAIQVQVHLGDGRADFDRRRAELEAGSTGGVREVELAGVDEAYDNAAQGVVGALVGEHFLQVTTIGGSFDEQHHLALAEAAVVGIER